MSQSLQVGFFSERLVMSYLVDVDFSSRDFELTRKAGISVRKNSGRAENIPRQEEIRYEWLWSVIVICIFRYFGCARALQITCT